MHCRNLHRPWPNPCGGDIGTCVRSGSRLLSRATNGSIDRAAGFSVVDIQRALASRQLTAKEIVERFLDSAKRRDAVLRSFISLDVEGAMAQAEAIDRRLQNGESIGPLAGVPVAIKDNICTEGLRTTAGSGMLRGYVPPYDAWTVSRLRDSGAVIIGKTNMDEFGMGSSTENSGFYPTKNPWNLEHVPGGSSGGSAAAVAARQCLLALGSDTGGSIRQPAHFCGVVGLKPTYGRVSRRGLISYASSLDVIGPMANSVADAASLLNIIAVADDLDSTCSHKKANDYTRNLVGLSQISDRPLLGKKIGLIRETMGDGVSRDVESAIRNAAKHLESLGAVVEETTLPSFRLGLPAYYVIAVSEASSNLSRYDGVRYGMRAAESKDLRSMYLASRAAMGNEVRRRILMGTYALSAGYYDAYYKKAQQVRTLISTEVVATLRSYDALLSPTAPTTAYRFGEKSKDPLSMYKGDLMTVNVNLVGLPAIALPCGFGSEGLPVGMQLIGKHWGEAELLEIAHVFEITNLHMNDFIPPDAETQSETNMR